MKDNKQKDKRLEVGFKSLQVYYVDRAKQLLECLKPYNDTYANELKEVLKSFIKNQNKGLKEMIDEIKSPVQAYNSFCVNDTMFDIYYVDAGLIKSVLEQR